MQMLQNTCFPESGYFGKSRSSIFRVFFGYFGKLQKSGYFAMFFLGISRCFFWVFRDVFFGYFLGILKSSNIWVFRDVFFGYFAMYFLGILFGYFEVGYFWVFRFREKYYIDFQHTSDLM